MARKKALFANSRGQAAVEYILVLGLTALFGMYLMRFVVDTFSLGIDSLSRNVGVRLETGEGFNP